MAVERGIVPEKKLSLNLRDPVEVAIFTLLFAIVVIAIVVSVIISINQAVTSQRCLMAGYSEGKYVFTEGKSYCLRVEDGSTVVIPLDEIRK